MTFPAEAARLTICEWLADYCAGRAEDDLGRGVCHAVLAGGKRLRPVLTLLWGQRFGAPPKALREACLAVELLHTYSLVHDDLPAMDDDDLRRGQPTVHVAFDEATAILVGDALLTEALGRFGMIKDANPEACLSALHCLHQAAGDRGMVRGQHLDLLQRAKTVDQVAEVHRLKTGALLSASCEIGAILGGASSADRDRCRRFGLHLGLAFQARDDLLDGVGDEQALGKPIGSDAQRELPTLLGILGPQGCQLRVEDETRLALDCLDVTNAEEHDIQGLAEWLLARQS